MDGELISTQADPSPPKGKEVSRFSAWLQAQLRERGWQRPEMARRGGISKSIVDKVINGESDPGLDFFRATAKAFGMPLEEVLRVGGVLPPVTGRDDTTRDLVSRLDSLHPSVREQLLQVWRANLDMAAILSSQIDDVKAFSQLLGRFPASRFEEIRRIIEDVASLDSEGPDDSDGPDMPAEPPATDE